MSDKYGTEPGKLSDIEINRVWETVCPWCGVIDAPRDIAVARRTRRQHFEAFHANRA